jgi:hypothetical protein
MVRKKLLLAASLSAILILIGVAVAYERANAASGQCSQGELRAGLCAPPEATGAINNGGVDLSAGFDTGGGGGSGGGQQADSGAGGAASGGAQGAAPAPNPLTIVRDGFTVNCTPGTPCDPNLVVRISDLVNFRPAAPTQGMEPHGWSVIGLPANFIAAAAVHVRSGLLLGFPAEVRFIPIGYRWNYGDGTRADSRSGGATWAALSLPEFSDTQTSHSFRASGQYSVSLAVVYSAEYRFAGLAWRGVQGTLLVPAGPLSAVVGDASTVLVDRECTKNPAGPGC